MEVKLKDWIKGRMAVYEVFLNPIKTLGNLYVVTEKQRN